MKKLAVLVSGVLFGMGLALSGMVNPAKVMNFLDLFGHWDPTLLVVMAGGLMTALIGYQVLFKRGKPFLVEAFSLPTLKSIDLRLVGGAALFGIGWGLTGACPGPAVAVAALGYQQGIMFLAAMAVGVLLARLLPAGQA